MPSALQGSCPSVDEAWQALWAELDANVGRRPANARQSLSALWCAAARRSQPTTESSLPPDAPILTNRRCSSRHLTPSRRHAPPRSPLSLRRGALLLSPLPLPDPPSTPCAASMSGKAPPPRAASTPPPAPRLDAHTPAPLRATLATPENRSVGADAQPGRPCCTPGRRPLQTPPSPALSCSQPNS
eukprot:TRINITY_DN7852_c0_g1_i1.p2 TRINITY_DN7852_c0_g1~~TRINITY_DN7852_c0_g1_i1.p2  ORF type:complete len:206 (+),score=15.43 TRINITY_DN7852_c0_g1_i1:61-618(+)